MSGRIVLVGESNPYGADPSNALVPWPPGCAGQRLCAILGYGDDHDAYLEAFDRVNLLAGRWSAPAARVAASRLTYARRVLLGVKVAAAHGIAFVPFSEVSGAGWRGVVLPHPSGRCRLWHERNAVALARTAVARLAAPSTVGHDGGTRPHEG